MVHHLLSGEVDRPLPADNTMATLLHLQDTREGHHQLIRATTTTLRLHSLDMVDIMQHSHRLALIKMAKGGLMATGMATTRRRKMVAMVGIMGGDRCSRCCMTIT